MCNLPSLTEKDERDIRAGVEAGIDFFALSFVRRATTSSRCGRCWTNWAREPRIVAKIEDQSGAATLQTSSRSPTPSWWPAAISASRSTTTPSLSCRRASSICCLVHGKPVIIATHLLESMILAPMPTRAEISDVSTAVRERADAVMLSGETTTGRYPLECVEVMKNIVKTIEPTETRRMNDVLALNEPKAKMLRSAAALAQELGSSGIVVFTRSGFLAYTLAALRAVGVPIYAFTDDEALFRQLLLPWGVEPFLMPFSDDPEKTIQDALAYLKRREWCDEGTWLVVITNALASGKVIDTLQLREVE